MRIAPAALAGLLLAGIGWAAQAPAQAQAAPQGSYLGSCGRVEMRGEALIASCRRRDGAWQRSALAWADRCAGDIGNDNGILRCTYDDGRPGYGRVLSGPGGPPVYGAPPPVSGGPPVYGAPPPVSGGPPVYGAPPPVYGEEYGRERWERCRRLRHEAEELRERLSREGDPRDRARLEYRLREVHEQEERCR